MPVAFTKGASDKVRALLMSIWLRALGFSKETLRSVDIAGPQRLSLIRRALRRFPRWAEGHQYCGWAAIACGQIELARASCAVAMQLEGSRAESNVELCTLRGVLAVRVAAFERAIELLKPIFDASDTRSTNSKRALIAEELAAAYAGIGQRETAKQILMSVPEQQLSAASQVALRGLSLNSSSK